jgi:drug/metabolite transporter (DMT)-like permease
MANSRPSRWKSYFFLLINTIVWGAALIIVKPALDVTTPMRFLLYRYFFAAIFALPFLFYYWPKVSNKFQVLKRISALELIGTTLGLSLLYIGLERTSAIEASLLATTTPIFIVLAGVLFLRERQERVESIGLSLAFGGTLLITIIPLLQNGSLQDSISLSCNLLIIGCNIATAAYFILAKKYYHGLPKLFVTTIGFFLGLVSFFFLSLLEVASLTGLALAIVQDFTAPSVWFASLYMALFGSIIGLTAYIKGQEGVEASEASLFWYLQPLIYLPLGIVLLAEQVYPIQIIGLGLILAGVLMAEQRTYTKPKKVT